VVSAIKVSNIKLNVGEENNGCHAKIRNGTAFLMLVVKVNCMLKTMNLNSQA
jgi:hypothetical protein